MIAALTGLGTTIANSRPMQFAIGVGLLILGFLWWLGQHDRRLLQNERARAERKARKVQARIESENDEKLDQAIIAERDAPRGVVATHQLSERTRRILFGDD